jgi:hypothetical protein
VIAILLAAARVAARGLQMGLGIGRYPHGGPRWRYRETADAGQRGDIRYRAPR